MHLPLTALGLFTALMVVTNAETPSLVLYSDTACQTPLATYETSDTDEAQCKGQVTSGAYSYEIVNDDHNCGAEHSQTFFDVYEDSDCSRSGDTLPSGCYLACTSLESSALNSYLWNTATEPVDPPKA